MGQYRARDLLLPPSWVSLLRVPLAIAFPWAVAQPPLALGIVALAAISDVLDGYLARRLGQATPLGAVIDGITDKLFVASVVASLYFEQTLSGLGVVLLGMRELGEAPLVLWWTLSQRRRKAKAEAPMANALGKLATVLQFISVAAVLLAPTYGTGLLWLTGAAGMVAAVGYWRRELVVVG
ncbi:MAG: CDP-alcohol phosphatidyltransferase family protein [Polyangiaceae bacterium]